MAGGGPHTSRSSLFSQQADSVQSDGQGCTTATSVINDRSQQEEWAQTDQSMFLALRLMLNSLFHLRDFFIFFFLPLWRISFWSGKYWKHPSPGISLHLQREAVFFLHRLGKICCIKRVMIFICEMSSSSTLPHLHLLTPPLVPSPPGTDPSADLTVPLRWKTIAASVCITVCNAANSGLIISCHRDKLKRCVKAACSSTRLETARDRP